MQIPTAILIGCTWLAPLQAVLAQNVEPPRRDVQQDKAIHLQGLSDALRERFADAERKGFRSDGLTAQQYECGCYDKPIKHYPYSIVVFKTAQGELVTRAERGDGPPRFFALAVRDGERYCDPAEEDRCFGSFSHPCDFTDFRYGESLAAYFPTCKSEELEPAPADSMKSNP